METTTSQNKSMLGIRSLWKHIYVVILTNRIAVQCQVMRMDQSQLMSSDESWTKLKALKQSLEFISFTEPHERVKTKL